MGGIYHKGQPYSGQMVVDTALSAASNNPLKNRSIAGIINEVVAPIENGSTASQGYSVGEEIFRNGALMKVLQAIASGGTFDDSSASPNIEDAGSIAEQLKALFDGETVLKKSPGTASTCAVHNTEAGVKLYWISSSTLDQPNSSFQYGFLINFSLGGTAPSYTNENGVQIAVKNNAQEIYIRKLANGAWDTTWKQIYGHVGTIYSYSIGSNSEAFVTSTPKSYTVNTTIPAGTYMISFETIAEVNMNEAYSNLEITVNGTKHRYYKGSCLGGAFPNVCVANQSISISITPQRTGDTYFYITVKLLRIQ